MSQPSEMELRRLHELGSELREAFAERGHRVGVALDADPNFGSGRSRSALRGDLVEGVLSQKAGAVGLGWRPVNGSGREVVGHRHRYRVRQAGRDAQGTVVIKVNTDTNLMLDEEEPTLFPLASWVLAWIPDPEGGIADVLVAEIRGYLPGKPGRMILGPEILLGGEGPWGAGFTPIDEGLPGFDEDEGEDEQDGSAGSHEA